MSDTLVLRQLTANFEVCDKILSPRGKNSGASSEEIANLPKYLLDRFAFLNSKPQFALTTHILRRLSCAEIRTYANIIRIENEEKMF